MTTPKGFPTRWPNGERMTVQVRDLLFAWSQLPRENFDLVVAISGPERIGKSNLGFQICKVLDAKFGLDQVTFRTPEFQGMGKHLGPGRARIHDEGPFSRDANTTENKELAEHIFRCGQLYLFNVIIKPNLRWMETVIREHRAQYWILVERRGWATVHKARRADYPGAKPGWDYLFDFPFKFWSPPWMEKYEALKRSDLFQDSEARELTWPDLRPDMLAQKFEGIKKAEAR